MLVVPPSGSIRSNSLKSTGLPLACSFSARFLVASINAFDDDGMPHLAVASSRPSGAGAHDRSHIIGKHARHRRKVADIPVTRVVQQPLTYVLPDRLGAGQPDCVGLLDFDDAAAAAAGYPSEHAAEFRTAAASVSGRSSRSRPGVGERVVQDGFPVFGLHRLRPGPGSVVLRARLPTQRLPAFPSASVSACASSRVDQSFEN